MPDNVELTLFDKVDELSRKLDDIILAVGRDAESRDRQTVMLERKLHKARQAIRLAVIAIVAVALLVVVRWRDDREQKHAACVASNRARLQSQARIEDAGSTLADSFARVIAAANPPKDQAAFTALFEGVKADYVQHMRDNWSPDLKPRDCG